MTRRSTGLDNYSWDEAFRRHHAQVTDSEVSTDRDSLLLTEVGRSIPASIQQGRAKESRKLALHTDASLPPESDAIPVWLRSEWDEGITAKQFDEAARRTRNAGERTLLERRARGNRHD